MRPARLPGGPSASCGSHQGHAARQGEMAAKVGWADRVDARFRFFVLHGRLTVICATRTACLLMVMLPLSAVVRGDDKADKEHAAMRQEHRQAAKEHQEWMSDISRMRVEHRRALAALAKLQAEILEHDAELEERAQEIRQHSHHIHEHDAEIADHESDDHDRLVKRHKKIQNEHVKFAKSFSEVSEDHRHLIGDLMKFVEGHLKKFHADDE